MSTKNSNKLNVPEAKAAMDQFKMEAASEEDVYLPQRFFPTLDFWLKYRENRLSRTFFTFLPQKRPLHDLYSPALDAGRLPILPR